MVAAIGDSESLFIRASSNPVASCTVFGHPGAGGSVGLADLEHKVAFAFVPNLRRDWLAGDRRAFRLMAAVYDAL